MTDNSVTNVCRHTIVLGAGGIGGYFAATLARAGHRVTIQARAAQSDAIRRHGLTVQTPDDQYTVSVPVTSDASTVTDATLVLLAIKEYALPVVAPTVQALAERGAVILPLLNGIDIVERCIALGVPRERLLGGLTTIFVVRTAPGRIERRSPFQRVLIGEVDGTPSARADAIAALFRSGGVDAAATQVITLELWKKLAFVATTAALCGLTRSAVGVVSAHPLGAVLVRRSVGEVGAVARACGIPFSPAMEAEVVHLCDALPWAMRPSFLADLERGGPTELDILSGTISRLGHQYGIETPLHDLATLVLASATAWSTVASDRR